MALASDVNNTQFVGAVDGDKALIVHFYVRPVQNNYASSVANRPVFEDVIYVKINVPGLKEMEVDTPARSDHQARFPVQYQHFVNRTQGDAREIGTPVAEWPVLTRSQAEEFRALKFFTVESIANASDLNINALGMIGGMSPYALRERARAFLQAAKDEALPQHQAEELAKRDAQIALLQEQMAQLAASVKPAPTAPIQATVVQAVTPPVVTVAPARKRGRPSKADIAARQGASPG